MGQTDLKPTAQGQVESSINDTINFIMAKVAAGEIDAATATELIAAARKDYESNVPVTTSAQQAVQLQQTANPYQADPQTAYAVPEMEPEQTPIDYGQFATSTNYPHTYDVEDSSDVDMDALSGIASDVFDKQPRKKLSRKERKARAKEMKKLQKESNAKLKANAKSNKSIQKQLKDRDKELSKKNEFARYVFTGLFYTYAPTKKQLDNQVLSIISAARQNSIEVSTYEYRQRQGFNSILPLGHNHCEISRMSTTAEVSILMPFATMELDDKGGNYYGQNKHSSNLIFCNRKLLASPMGFVCGKTGSGKGMAVKTEMTGTILSNPTDEIYIIDRAGEYTGISSRYGGVTYNFAVDSDTYLNPFDTVSVESLSPDAQLAFKIDAMLAQAGASAAEAGRDLGEEDQSIITRCVQEAFFDARQRGEQPPLLEDFYNKLLEQPERYCKRQGGKVAMSSNNPNRVYLDTETTGLHPEEGDEILSLTIVDANGRLLFDERFKPKHKKEWPEAQAVNHISPDDVEHLTTIDAYMEQICRILDRIADEIVGYNIAFDIGFLKAAGATINPDAAIIDTMQEFMDAFGNSNTGHRYQPLSMAAERLGYNWTSAPHGSLSDTLACLAAQKCVDDHNWCVENLELTEDAIMHAKPIENGSEGLPKDCWDLNPGGRPFAVTEPILHRLQSSAKLCARAGTTTQFTRMTVNQWFDKAERSQRSPLGRSVDIGRAASALNSQHEHAEVPQDLTK